MLKELNENNANVESTEELEDLTERCGNASLVYGPLGSVTTGLSLSNKKEVYRAENYKDGAQYVSEAKNFGLDLAVSTTAVVLGSMVGGPVGAVVLGSLASMGCELFRQYQANKFDTGRVLLAGALGALPGVGKAFFNRLLWKHGVVQRFAGKLPDTLVKEQGVKATARRTLLGAWDGAYYGGSMAYQNRFGFGLYEHVKQGNPLTMKAIKEQNFHASQEGMRGVLIGLASGGLTRGLLPLNRV